MQVENQCSGIIPHPTLYTKVPHTSVQGDNKLYSELGYFCEAKEILSEAWLHETTGAFAKGCKRSHVPQCSSGCKDYGTTGW